MKESGQDGTKLATVNYEPMLYYKKPAIGAVTSYGSQNSVAAPVQILFPSGQIGVGIPAKDSSLEGSMAIERLGMGGATTVICSGPENGDLDRWQHRALTKAFLGLALVNLVVTSILFSKAAVIDISLVAYPAPDPNNPGALPRAFQAVSSHRRGIEEMNFAWIIITLILGVVSAVFESALGLSAYCLSVMLNFLLSTFSLPSFLFSFRYVLDAFMIYFALVLRSKLFLHFLPVIQPQHTHRN